MIDLTTIFVPGWAHSPGVFNRLRREIGDIRHFEGFSLSDLSRIGNQVTASPSAGLPSGGRPARCTTRQQRAESGERTAAAAPSSPCAPVSAMARTLSARVQACSGDVELIGWSTGAMVALEATAANPARVSRLVLISGTPKFCKSADWRHGLRTASVRALSIGLRRSPERTLSGFFQLAARPVHASDASVRDRVVAAMSSMDTCELAEQLDYLLKTDLRSHVSQIETPCLLVHGDKDAVVPAGASRWLAGQLAHSRLDVLTDAGHSLPVHAVTQLAERIRDFRDE